MKIFGLLEWQCACGAWIDDVFDTHSHMSAKEPTFEQMHALRRAQAAGLTGVEPDHFTATAEVTRYFRTGKEPTRDKPL